MLKASFLLSITSIGLLPNIGSTSPRAKLCKDMDKNDVFIKVVVDSEISAEEIQNQDMANCREIGPVRLTDAWSFTVKHAPETVPHTTQNVHKKKKII